ncbi:caspase recruitment domain-containing protein 9 [Salminus brasiliensis]|uniref:caspase recruitment domain-containing protein 9 n=1 Tax=Salminus brasiliensis TaxID=930266 RepID=UPI003B838880
MTTADGSSALEVEEDEECWMRLEDHRMILIKTIEPSRIIPYLRQCKVLNSEDEEQIYNDPSLVVRRRKVGMLLDLLQRTGLKGYVAFLESLELDYPQLYQKITGKEPSRVFSILIDTAGESGLTQFLMNEVSKLQKALQDERRSRLEASARAAEHVDSARQLQTRECELRKQHERVQRMREEREQLWNEARRLKDENYRLMHDVTRLSEEKNGALMCNRDLQLEIERLKHSLMNAESDSKLQRKRTMTLKNAMEQRPSQEMILELQKQNDLLTAQVQELQNSSQVQIPIEHDLRSKEMLEDFKKQSQTQHQDLVNSLYTLRRELHDAEELRDKYREKKDELELKCAILKKDSKMYCNRMEEILKQLDEVIKERDKAIAAREEYHQDSCKNLQDKDRYRKKIREMGEHYDELQVQLFRTQGEVVALQSKFRKQTSLQETIGTSEESFYQSSVELKSQTSEEDFKERYDKASGISEDSQSPTSGEYNVCISIKDPCPADIKEEGFKERMYTEEDLSASYSPRTRSNFHNRRKRALRTKATVKESTIERVTCILDNTSGSDNTDTDGI